MSIQVRHGATREIHNATRFMSNLLQKHWEWQENRREDLEHGKFKYKTMCMANLDVKTAFDVANPSVVSKIRPLIGTHGHVVAVLLAEM